MGGADGYTLTGTVSQPAAGSAAQDANGHALRDGFWNGLDAANDRIFRAGFEQAP